MSSLREIGERRAIEQLARKLSSGKTVRVGIGDDAAVVKCSGEFDLLLTSDPLIENVHFRASADPLQIGHKAMGRVLSDLAAMGGEPLWSLINVAAPARSDLKHLERIYEGAHRLARRHGLSIVGGDLARAGKLHLHVFAVGRVPRGKAVTRAGARPGDGIYVTGRLGGSRSGKHLKFEPRVAEGRWLREGQWVTAMIDLSDGLAGDLRQILEQSAVGADVRTAQIPISESARRARDGRSPLDHALGDGEDFELLFTVPARRAIAFESAWSRRFRLKCVRIGNITRKRHALILVNHRGERTACPLFGYDHFR